MRRLTIYRALPAAEGLSVDKWFGSSGSLHVMNLACS